MTLLEQEYVDQMNLRYAGELSAHMMYLNLANLCQQVGLFGAQEFFLSESKDELKHSQKIAAFLNDYGIIVTANPVLNVPEMPEDQRLTKMLKVAFDAEVNLYKEYSKLAAMAMAEMGVHSFALSFVDIQRKAMGEYNDHIARLNQSGDIYAFDLYLKELAG